MKELLSIIEMHRKAKVDGKQMALATVVQVEGSAYRRPGACMLIVEDGATAGSVSGGCLERDVVEQSLRLIESNETERSIQYNTSHDDDALFGSGTGCTGTVVIRIERIDQADNLEVISERLKDRMHLVIFGGGHDAPALAQLADHMGLRVTVLDHRAGFAIKSRFPHSANVVNYKPEDLSTWPQLDERSYCVVMAHNLTVDKQVLSHLLDLPHAYVGVLGPKKRTENMLQRIRESGKNVSDLQLKNLHAPVGLDIGAETPDQIALAILAEIQAVSTGRAAGFLRDRTQPIHEESSNAIQVEPVRIPQSKKEIECPVQP